MVVLIVILLLIAGLVANSITLNEYVLSPGLAQPVGPLVTIPSLKGHTRQHQIYLTDVYLTQVKALQWPLDELNSNDAVYSTTALFGGPAQPAQVQQQEALQMVSSSEQARVVALRYLGYAVPERTGAVVLEIVAGGAASRLTDLQLGDAITAVGGHPTPTSADVAAALAREHPGQRVTLTVRHVDGAHGTESLVLGHKPGHPTAPFAGVGLGNAPYYVLPFQVDINSDGIGGPSAGLAFTLGIINALSGGDLTGGHRVAATGTIDLKDRVGVVGGVPQKTIAVRNAGATVFLVPPGNYHDALSKAGPHLHVIEVATLGQALHALQRLGGHVPPARSSPPPSKA